MSSGATSIYPQDNINPSKSFQELIYEFDNFRLDCAHRMLYENNQPVALGPKVIETLIALVEKRGEIVSKHELMSRLWGGSFVEESNLTQNIYLLRKALGMTASGAPLIESFRRRGYRFNGEIQVREGNSLVAEKESISKQPLDEIRLAATEVAAAPVPQSALNRKTKVYFVAGAISACCLVLLAGFIVNSLSRSKTASALVPALRITRLTPDLNIGYSTFTPDGTHLAYVLVEQEKQSVWLKDLATGAATRILPPTEEGYGHLRFSPERQTIYYLTHRKDAPNGTIIKLQLSGSIEQKVAVDAISPFALSPDEKQLAFINSKSQLLVAQTDGSGERVLAQREWKKAWFETWNSILSWSPDGERIAVCGGESDARGKRKAELLDISARDGSIRLIPIPDWSSVDDAIWSRDQSALLVVVRESEISPSQIWKIAYPSGSAARITNDTNSYDDIALSADSHRLVAMQNFHNTNIWTVSTDVPTQAKQLTFGSAASDGTSGIAFTPDRKIIYTSPRDGHLDLWVMNADGSDQKQLTKNAGDYNARPVVMPDGRSIIFTSSRSGKRQIWRMDADGANPQQLTDAETGATEPAVSPGGEWVYFTMEGEVGSIWKVRIDGSEMVRVSPIGSAWLPSLSPDGKLISYSFYDYGASQPWKIGIMRAADGAILKTFDTFCYRHLTQWTADGKALIYINSETVDLWQLPIDGGQPRRLSNFESGRLPCFAVSPDRKRLAVARGNPSAEAVLLENF